MNAFISMLRGVNVGGKRRVPMDRLRECYESLEFGKVRTYIQSGNVVFENRKLDTGVIGKKIEKAIRDEFGFGVTVIIRTKEDMMRVIKNLPFAGLDESKIHVTFLSARPANVPTNEIEKARDNAERFTVSEREVYLFCPNGYGKSKLSNSFFEHKLNVAATTRNWRTVNTLYALASQ